MPGQGSSRSAQRGFLCPLSWGQGVRRPESPTQRAISLFLLLRGEALHRHSVEEEVIFLSSWRRNSGVSGATHPF